MPEMNEEVEAQVVTVYDDYCVVQCVWGTYNMVTGSVQGLPRGQRLVGLRGRMRWVQTGGYCGPVWISAES